MGKPLLRLWHYTIGECLPSLLESGEIRCAIDLVPEGERPVVWFSANPVWEETANKGWLDEWGHQRGLTKDETHEKGGGLIRIEVNPESASYTWEDFKRLSNIPPKRAKALGKCAKEGGSSASQWYVSFKPVPLSEWLAIEAWNGSEWMAIEDWKQRKTEAA